MSDDLSAISSTTRTWHHIRQEVAPRAMSPQGRRRQRMLWLKLGGLAAFLLAVTAGLWALARTWESDRGAVADAARSSAVRDIVLITDGVLSRDWVATRLTLPKHATLMELDLDALRDRLAASPQIRVVVVARSFPDTLVVTLQERSPVARIQAQEGSGAPHTLLVAKDGVVYEGQGYDPHLVTQLPWLAGFSLRRAADGSLLPLAGLDVVSELLSTAQLQAPWLYQDWLVVSLERLESNDEIIVKAQRIPEIIFHRHESFFRQIARLDYIADQTTTAMRGVEVAEGAPLVRSVNLGLGSQVPVELALTPAEAERTARAAADAPRLNLQLPSQRQRKTGRDL